MDLRGELALQRQCAALQRKLGQELASEQGRKVLRDTESLLGRAPELLGKLVDGGAAERLADAVRAEDLGAARDVASAVGVPVQELEQRAQELQVRQEDSSSILYDDIRTTYDVHFLI